MWAPHPGFLVKAGQHKPALAPAPAPCTAQLGAQLGTGVPTLAALSSRLAAFSPPQPPPSGFPRGHHSTPAGSLNVFSFKTRCQTEGSLEDPSRTGVHQERESGVSLGDDASCSRLLHARVYPGGCSAQVATFSPSAAFLGCAFSP